ncbi:hypothetical protein [Bacillus cabrialesii]|uniref:Uncharacterized protein n=1 Tax=Bacillus cabrialesii subsp. tritici TaxID=2944916 RepID=A0ABT9DGZ3_9BACI|nr:hypothetical protein [Bacillus cabrialesii]MDO8223946.1 hypothetical protein [Bacillus cabrialesii subsp. tritici]
MHYNGKKEFINKAIQAMSLINSVKDTGYNDTFTYFTPGLIIKGKPFEYETFTAKDPESIEEEMEQKQDKINVFNVAEVLYKFSKNVKSNEEDAKYYDEDKVLILQDVSILNLQTGGKYNLSHYVLFVDQITGFVPAPLELNNM